MTMSFPNRLPIIGSDGCLVALISWPFSSEMAVSQPQAPTPYETSAKSQSLAYRAVLLAIRRLNTWKHEP
jgi:hypothetical protein